MAIFQFSRYTDSVVVNVAVAGKTRKVIVPSPPRPYVITFRSYLVTANDTLDDLAATFFGNATWWWKIADANPEIRDWTSLAVGTVIRIPVAATP